MEEDEDEKMEDAEEEEEADFICGVNTNEEDEDDEEEEAVFIRGVNTKEEEEAMVELFYSHNRRGSTQHATRATLDDTCPN